jgi:pyruvate,orthophosphate dikinase
VKRIYKFSGTTAEGNPDDKMLLGGKGAGLALMAKMGLNVPPGFTITTDVCKAYMACSTDTARVAFMDDLMEEVYEGLGWLSDQFGYLPLVSVRSGAPVSMPGMMDTILNVNLTSVSINDWIAKLGERSARDSMRRLIQMLGSTAFGVPHDVFEFQLARIKKQAKVTEDTELNAHQLMLVGDAYLDAFKKATGQEFPIIKHREQLRYAVEAVFKSWMNDRAVEYRKINKIDEAMATAVTVQAMVFGNAGDSSASGVLFTRDPSTGENTLMGEFLQNAQGEDVVAGIRTPLPLSKMNDMGAPWPDVLDELVATSFQLEKSYKDMVDVEFTVQDGEVFILQSRSGKRSARAAFKIAVDQVAEGMITKGDAFKRLSVDQFKTVRKPGIDPKWKQAPYVVGLPACPGIAVGRPVFSSAEAVKAAAKGEKVVLVTHETTPEDIAGMNAAQGILTQTGGATSHAAVVARAMDKPCITGATQLDLDALMACQKVTIDGSTGKVWTDVEVPVIDASDDPAIRTVMDWSLAILGAQEAAVVDLDMDKPHRIMAALWWGQEEVLDAVLDGLEKLPSRQHVAFDLRSPASFQPTADKGLADCFGVTPELGLDFAAKVIAKIEARGDKLKGLQLLNSKPYLANQLVPSVVPADYAAFTVLSR